MTGTAAVIAHFDPDDRLDPTFRTVLDCLKELCDKIVIVTTCNLPKSEIPADPSIVTILRPNIGYDFYSYRVGIEEIHRQGGCERLFVLNSSFLVLHRERFRSALERMLYLSSEVGIVGVTRSNQFQQHLQSYLLLLRGDVLACGWFQEWLKGISPRNSKLETILAGELGLSQAIARNKVATEVLFRPTLKATLLAHLAWGGRLIGLGGISGVLRAYPLRRIREFNPVHFAARPLAEQFGLVKAELLRTNPHRLDISWVDATSTSDECEVVREFVERSRSHYQPAGNGLTVLNSGASSLPTCNLVYSGPLARPGVRVAVVVHVFYPELIDEIGDHLRHIVEPFDLFVTTPHEGAVSTIFNRFSSLAQSIAVGLCENRGRDIGPFMAIHRRKLLDPYEAVLKLHTKRSTYSEKGASWRASLFRELCGNSLAVQKTLNLLRSGHVGIIGPHGYYLTHKHFWGGNLKRVQSLLDVIGIQRTTDEPSLGFFAGSMFWFNPVALAPLHAIPDGYLAFEPEGGQQDGTLAHAFERIFSDIARSAGYSSTSLTLGGDEISHITTDYHSVPVLSFSARQESASNKHGENIRRA